MKSVALLGYAIAAMATVGCQTYVVNVPPPRKPVYTETYRAPKKTMNTITPTVNQTPDVVRSWEMGN